MGATDPQDIVLEEKYSGDLMWFSGHQYRLVGFIPAQDGWPGDRWVYVPLSSPLKRCALPVEIGHLKVEA